MAYVYNVGISVPFQKMSSINVILNQIDPQRTWSFYSIN
ncbi:MAG: hypothetical protein ACI88A_002717 [Paraglaciecola sp.]|jgi:hypothetical protein